MVAGSFLAIASLGLAAAMISGLTLEEGSRRTLNRVATAENLLAQMRVKSQDDFPRVVGDFDGVAKSGESSVGFEAGMNSPLRVAISLDETLVPGQVDLDGDGTIGSTVTADTARVLVADLSGPGGLRFRSAVANFNRLRGISIDREAPGLGPVEFGEVRTPPPPPPPPEPPVYDQDAPTTVSVTASSISSGVAQLALRNDGTTARKVVTMTIAPDSDSLYFSQIDLNDTIIYTPPVDQSPGTVTFAVTSTESFDPGEATLSIGQFYTVDKKGKKQVADPGQVAVTIAYDDGSVTSTVVK
jgi:hypothetical protein